MRRQKLYRIAVVGPESSGKSVLAEQLALHYESIWVKEYSREYLHHIDGEYTYDNILSIAKGQYEREKEKLINAEKYLFCDTEFIVNKIWCLEKYGRCHQWILDMQKKHPYDLYLLCRPDLPWEADPLREAPEIEERQRLFDVYLKELQEQKLTYGIVEGIDEARLEVAIRIIDSKF